MRCHPFLPGSTSRHLPVLLGAAALVIASSTWAADTALQLNRPTQTGWRPKPAKIVPAAAAEAIEDAPAADPAPIPADELPAEPIAPAPAAENAADPNAGPGKTSSAEADLPACIQCGATCGLIPFCRCEPVIRKKPKTIYESKCELVCEPAVGLLHHHRQKHQHGGCSDCGPACGPSRIRKKKTLIKTVKEEDVCHVKREVGYICRCCAGQCSGCDAAGCSTPPAGQRPTLADWRPFAWLETIWK